MAIRVSQKHVQTLLPQLRRQITRAPSSIAVNPFEHVPAPEPEHQEPVAPPQTTTIPPSSTSSGILDFSDVRSLFSSVATNKLIKSTANLTMASMDPMVDFGMWVMKSKELMETPVVKDIIMGTVKKTFYEQFVAGETLEETSRTVTKLYESGMRAMLVYGLEHAHDNAACDRNFDIFHKTIESTAAFPAGSVSFVIVKISAIAPLKILNRVSDLLRWQQKNPSFNLPWKRQSLPILAESSPFYHTLTEPAPLTPEEEKDLELAYQRLAKLCQRCLDLNVPLTVDAEETSVNPAIDYLTYAAAIDFKKECNNQSPFLFNTIQCYLKDAKDRLGLTMKGAEDMGVPVGFKLVRGAYMSHESKVAKDLGFESPIHNGIQDTHNCYNDCSSFMLDKVAKGTGAVVLATHNVESGKLAAAKAKELGIGKENDRFQFAQLYGMSDALSFGLRNAGFQVSKYLTFGPVSEVMPYLLRRAEENRGMLSSSTLDRQLMAKEIRRRLSGGILKA